MNVFEDIVKAELINVIHFYFALSPAESLLDAPSAHLTLGNRTYSPLLLIHSPGLDVLELLEEGPHANSHLYLFGLLHVND